MCWLAGIVSSASMLHNITELCEQNSYDQFAKFGIHWHLSVVVNLCVMITHILMQTVSPMRTIYGAVGEIEYNERPLCSVQRHQWTKLGMVWVSQSLELLHSQK